MQAATALTRMARRRQSPLAFQFQLLAFVSGEGSRTEPIRGECGLKYLHAAVSKEPAAKTHRLGAGIRSLILHKYFALDAGIEWVSSQSRSSQLRQRVF